MFRVEYFSKWLKKFREGPKISTKNIVFFDRIVILAKSNCIGGVTIYRKGNGHEK